MNLKPIKILAIESSCDETAAAIICESKDFSPVISSNIVSSQIDMHAKTGGVVPEVASRAHMESILPVIEESLGNEKLENITHIAVTAGPGLIGSLLVGFNTAKALAYSLDIPIIPINHIEGHIYSALAEREKVEFPILALTVSGGHTSLTLVKDHLEYENIGLTLDDATGEAFDKVAKLLDLGYPGGPVVSKLAKGFRDQGKTAEIIFPRPILNDGTFNFSFSGLKTAVLTKVKQLTANGESLSDNIKAEICCAFEDAVVEVLVQKTLKAAEQYNPKSVILAGGVAANKRLREELSRQLESNGYNLILPSPELCGDNAAMIGVAAYYHILKNDIKSWNEISVASNLKL